MRVTFTRIRLTTRGVTDPQVLARTLLGGDTTSNFNCSVKIFVFLSPDLRRYNSSLALFLEGFAGGGDWGRWWWWTAAAVANDVESAVDRIGLMQGGPPAPPFILPFTCLTRPGSTILSSQILLLLLSTAFRAQSPGLLAGRSDKMIIFSYG